MSKTSLHANLPVYITLTDKAPTKEYTFSHFPYKYSDDHIYVHCPVHVENTIKSLEGNGDVVTTERFFEKTIVVPVSLQDTPDNGKFLLQVKKKKSSGSSKQYPTAIVKECIMTHPCETYVNRIRYKPLPIYTIGGLVSIRCPSPPNPFIWMTQFVTSSNGTP